MNQTGPTTRLVWGVRIAVADVDRVRSMIAEHKVRGIEVIATGRAGSRFAVVASWVMLLAHDFTREPLSLAQIAPEYGPADNGEESRMLEALCEAFQRMRPMVEYGECQWWIVGSES